MRKFKDINGADVEISFNEDCFPNKPEHVLVICEYDGKWLLTKHKKRGLEFPGGKMEQGETLEDASRREVFEETGASLKQLARIAEYRVTDAEGSFVKAVYWGIADVIHKQEDYHETLGPRLLEGDIQQARFGCEFSFIMKDDVIGECLKRISGMRRKQ